MKFSSSLIFSPLLFSIVPMAMGWIMGWMFPSPIVDWIMDRYFWVKILGWISFCVNDPLLIIADCWQRIFGHKRLQLCGVLILQELKMDFKLWKTPMQSAFWTTWLQQVLKMQRRQLSKQGLRSGRDCTILIWKLDYLSFSICSSQRLWVPCQGKCLVAKNIPKLFLPTAREVYVFRGVCLFMEEGG